ncbi:flagellar biosynthetic protein FliO [Vibrio sp. JC009]|uniref:flagellar biosynthetic protein FliO n=1 Tax=Vibrio sp. JC009 TaxID=2912314 RepID=UPI0023AED543|nr:flagellar biosynthetic protein FliO [Vibrio sp. JC009]WED21055.1 flagellar biosynthetic protein FliO [Vibrio sp. JC009]
MRPVAILSGILSATPAYAAGAPDMDLLTTFGSLVLVIGVIFGLAWVLKRMQLPAMGNQKDLRVVRQMPMGAKERIAVIQVGEEQFVIGVTAQSINLISRLDKPITEQATDTSPFARQLTQLLKKDENK